MALAQVWSSASVFEGGAAEFDYEFHGILQETGNSWLERRRDPEQCIGFIGDLRFGQPDMRFMFWTA